MKTLIVDDHPLFRAGLAALLRTDPDSRVLEGADREAGLALAASHPDLDLILLDLGLPDGGGPDAIPRFRLARPDVPVVVLSASEDPNDVRRSLAAGALGYIPKSSKPGQLLAALRFVMEGNIYVPPIAVLSADASPPEPGRPSRVGLLTERQLEVLRALRRGLSNKEVARELGVSDKTVKAHLSAIFQVLEVGNRTDAAAAARARGLI
jgi:DNA-binding NarL/FixJ family response regulator